MSEEREITYVTFIRTQQQSLYRFAYSYTKNEQDALDILQDSIQKGWIALNNLEDINKMKSWFYSILVRTAIDFLRKHKRIQLVGDELLEQLSTTDSYHDIDLHQAIVQLPLIYREIIILRFFEDLKIEEVAAILNLPISTTKSRLYKGLKLLKIELHTMEEDV